MILIGFNNSLLNNLDFIKRENDELILVLSNEWM